MNIAIVVDDLIQKGGQEKLVNYVSEIWPEAPIYTLIASDYWKTHYSKKGVRINVSALDKFPLAAKLNRYFAPFLLQLINFDAFDLSSFDAVVSISSRFAHSIVTKPTTLHICYMNHPGRMFWEMNNYFENETYGYLTPIKFLARPFLSPFLSYIREALFVAAQRVDYLFANSSNVKNKIQKYLKRDSQILYPFVETSKFNVPKLAQIDPYFILITRLVSWKRVDIAIQACNKLGLKLKVLGEGPHKTELMKMAGPTIEFIDTSDASKIHALVNAQALIQTQEEDFGIVPLEAMAAGIPVIAYGKGGVLETVIDGKTGVFYNQQNADALAEILKNFSPAQFSSQNCRQRAQQFDVTVFQRDLKNYVEILLRGRSIV